MARYEGIKPARVSSSSSSLSMSITITSTLPYYLINQSLLNLLSYIFMQRKRCEMRSWVFNKTGSSSSYEETSFQNSKHLFRRRCMVKYVLRALGLSLLLNPPSDIYNLFSEQGMLACFHITFLVHMKYRGYYNNKQSE